MQIKCRFITNCRIRSQNCFDVRDYYGIGRPAGCYRNMLRLQEGNKMEQNGPNLKVLYAVSFFASMVMLGMSFVGVLVFNDTKFYVGTVFFGLYFCFSAYKVFRMLFKKQSKTLLSRLNQGNSEEDESTSISNDFH